MVRIRRFGVLKTATVVAVMYALITLVIFVPFALLAAVFGRGGGANASLGIIVVAVLIPIIYAVLGWIITAIACALYNVAAGWVGGIEVELESVVPPPQPPAWGPTTQAPPGPPSAT